jgi:hypothetical protein
MTKPLRYVVLLGRGDEPPHLYDTETQVKIMSYPTVVEAAGHAAQSVHTLLGWRLSNITRLSPLYAGW